MPDQVANTKPASNIVLQCPQCKKPVHWNERYPHRPFCSKRCQQLDFGEWATEKNTIASAVVMSDDDEWQGD
ncbi:MAG: DNA gyrase inhibitor YacG [Porticoccaceae bacterium]|nr:DNA gyrase inhibitor YacG [Porticoccaceae bacterium]